MESTGLDARQGHTGWGVLWRPGSARWSCPATRRARQALLTGRPCRSLFHGSSASGQLTCGSAAGQIPAESTRPRNRSGMSGNRPSTTACACKECGRRHERSKRARDACHQACKPPLPARHAGLALAKAWIRQRGSRALGLTPGFSGTTRRARGRQSASPLPGTAAPSPPPCAPQDTAGRTAAFQRCRACAGERGGGRGPGFMRKQREHREAGWHPAQPCRSIRGVPGRRPSEPLCVG